MHFYGLAQDDYYSTLCPSGDVYPDIITGECPGNGSSGIPDWLRALTIVGQTAVQIVQAENQYYRTPYGTYSYGTGPYSSLSYSQAQQAALYYQGSASTSGSSMGILLLVGLVLIMMMRK